MHLNFPGLPLGKPQPKLPISPTVVAITSPYGSTGKTTFAINLATELSFSKFRVLLMDADIGGPSIANHFMLADQPAGFSAALRIASQGRFDLPQLERLTAAPANSKLKVMPGPLVSTSTVGEVNYVSSVLEVAKQAFDFIVVDLGPVPPQEKNCQQSEVTRAVMAHADKAVIVSLADPIGIFRLLSVEADIESLAKTPVVVVNRVRNSVIDQAKREIGITLQRLSRLEIATYLPDDPQHVDQALKKAIPTVSLSRTGTYRQAITGFARGHIIGSQESLDSRVAKLG